MLRIVSPERADDRNPVIAGRTDLDGADRVDTADRDQRQICGRSYFQDRLSLENDQLPLSRAGKKRTDAEIVSTFPLSRPGRFRGSRRRADNRRRRKQAACVGDRDILIADVQALGAEQKRQIHPVIYNERQSQQRGHPSSFATVAYPIFRRKRFCAKLDHGNAPSGGCGNFMFQRGFRDNPGIEDSIEGEIDHVGQEAWLSLAPSSSIARISSTKPTLMSPLMNRG